MNKTNTIYDLLIIGSGAAGLSAGLYAGRYRMKTAILAGDFGGATASAGLIENYPGFKSIDGYELMEKMREQVEVLGVEYIDEKIIDIKKEGNYFELSDRKKIYRANTIILTIGAERKELGLPNEKELKGRGVHYCITCDGPVYNGKKIAIVGGGDASIKGANLASEYAQKIFLIVRGKQINAEPINYERMKKLGDKVEVLFETEIKELVGKEKLQNLILSKPYSGSTSLAVDGVFVEIGALPNDKFAKLLGIELDKYGYIQVDNMMRTNIKGVFAAGDIVNHFGGFKQIITAAAMGSVAATSAYEYKETM